MGRHSIPGPGEAFGEPAEPADPASGRFPRAEGDDGLTATGRQRAAFEGGHRSEGGRRGVSIGVIVALITVVVVVGGVILWRFFGDVLSHRSSSAAQQCLGGTASVPVVVDPSIADNVKKFAEEFNTTAKPVGDRCVKMTVTQGGSDAVVSGFIGDWPGDLGERPALWIPASSVSAARLQAAAGKESVSDARSLVSSPVVLAVRPQLKDALSQQSWAALPGLQANPTALDAVNLPGWGSLRLALPVVGDSDASYLAAEAVAAASAPPGAPATAGLGAVNTLVAGQPKLADNTADTAWTALRADGDPAAAPVHAMVTTEQQVFQRSSSIPDAKNAVASWLPPGPVALADYPTVLLSGTWLSEEQVSAASEFARFMHKPEQLAQLASAGFRAEGASPKGNDVVEFGPIGEPLAVGDEALRATLADALTSPATGSATTVMLDQALSGDEGGKPRLANVTGALDNRIRALPPNSAVGLWTFNGVESRSVVPLGPLSDPVGGQPRTAALSGALQGMAPSGSGAVSFTTLRIVYNDALANYRPGQANSVLVITQGPHTDQSLDAAGLQDFVRSAADPNRPIAINVIDLGDDPDRVTWEAVAQASGGSYQNVGASDSPELATAVTTLVS